jgi:type I restriction enzyme R subunit
MTDTLPTVGQLERNTHNRVVSLLQERLGYEYLGNWEEREGNSNIEVEYLKNNLLARGYSESLADRAIHEFQRTANDQTLSLYDLNKQTYSQLRYGVKIQENLGENHQNVHLIDWEHPEANHFAFAEEVTIKGKKTKRPDVVLYINGIAVVVIELKRSLVSVSEGIRQNIGNQKDDFIKQFFATSQLIMAGNDTEGLRYGTTETTEEYFLTWKESGLEDEIRLDRHLLQMLDKQRLLDIIHNFIVFDAGIKKTSRHNQYFGVMEARKAVKAHEGGIIWHTQGSGKSLTMVWLAKWIRENIDHSRVLVLTDRRELDQQIETVFQGVDEHIHRTKSGRDLATQLGSTEKWLLCSLIHKFGRNTDDTTDADIDNYMNDIQQYLADGFHAEGDLFVFVDECHRTQSGKLHDAMKKLLPNATFIGFTGTPLLKVDKNSIGVFGSYIHTYKYDEAVADKVVLDLRYEARRVDQNLSSQDKIDEWFEERTKGLTNVAKAELKKRWGTMQALLSGTARLERIVFDILDDFYKKTRLANGRGNAMLVASSIYEACRYYEIFVQQGFEKCAIVTSYEPGALQTEDREYRIYQKMLNGKDPDDFEKEVKKKFVKQPGQMQLLIVVDKLLTGFDAPSATYLYIDKNMQDHGLFQAICRVNRLDTEDKDFGYIVDYRDLFGKLEQAITDYTSGAFDSFDKEDVLGLLKDRLQEGRHDLEDALETVRMLCEPVQPPRSSVEYIGYFCGDVENPYSLKENEVKRVKLYKSVAKLIRLYADLANDLDKAGYSDEEAEKLSSEIKHYEQVRTEIKLASGDYIDLKKYEPAMRTLIDRYVTASESEKLSAFDDLGLVDLIIKKGEDFVEELPDSIKKNRESVAATIENNVRRLIVEEMPANPKYFLQMSEILDDLVKRRKQADIEYQEYLQRIIELTKHVRHPEESSHYPSTMNNHARRALYDNLDENEELAISIDEAVRRHAPADFRGNVIRERLVKRLIADIIGNDDVRVKSVFDIIVNQDEY